MRAASSKTPTWEATQMLAVITNSHLKAATTTAARVPEALMAPVARHCSETKTRTLIRSNVEWENKSDKEGVYIA